MCVLRGAGQVDQCTRMGREQRGSRVAGRLGRLGRGVACVADWRRTGFEICIGAHSSIWRAGGGSAEVSISAMRAVVAVMRAFISRSGFVAISEAGGPRRRGYVLWVGGRVRTTTPTLTHLTVNIMLSTTRCGWLQRRASTV